MPQEPSGGLLGQRAEGEFFASLRKEWVHHADFATWAEGRAALFEYIEVFYNGQRGHSSLGYVSPVEYEQSATP